MKISKITLENIRCFENLEIDLKTENGIADWLVILGDNGVGKTTLIRSIALGLCEESSAAGLLDELASDWIRKEDKNNKAKIRIEFERNDAYIETLIEGTMYKEIQVEQTVRPKDEKFWSNLFICGYGANRRSYGTTSYSEYTATDAIYSLFNYDTAMQNIELNLRRLDKEIDIEALFRKLEDVLMLKKGSIKLKRNGIFINGPWGSYLPIGTLGDGYQAMFAWIMDMYGWKFLNEMKMADAEIHGIVIVDEIEQHLHPFWQKEIISRLHRQFKNVQFIISTHSPIVTMNSYSNSRTKFKSKQYVLKWHDKQVKNSEITERIDTLNYDQLLGSEAFGHIYNTNTEVDMMLREMSKLASLDRPNKSQSEMLSKIKQELKQIMFPEGRTLIERIVERDYYKELEKENKKFKEILEKKANK